MSVFTGACKRTAAKLSPAARGLLWAAVSGAIVCVLNALWRGLAQQLHPLQTQFLRYIAATLWVARREQRRAIPRHPALNTGPEL